MIAVPPGRVRVAELVQAQGYQPARYHEGEDGQPVAPPRGEARDPYDRAGNGEAGDDGEEDRARPDRGTRSPPSAVHTVRSAGHTGTLYPARMTGDTGIESTERLLRQEAGRPTTEQRA